MTQMDEKPFKTNLGDILPNHGGNVFVIATCWRNREPKFEGAEERLQEYCTALLTADVARQIEGRSKFDDR